MSRNEDISTSIWADPEVEELAADSKLLFIWSFTNEHNNMAGLYKISERMIMFETGLSKQRLASALEELAATDFLSYIDHVVFVRSRVARLRTKTPQIARSIAKSVEKLAPDNPQRLAFMRLYSMEEWLQEHLALLMPEHGWEQSSYVSPKRRAAVFERDGYRCVDCGSTETLTIDHVQPRSAGGSGQMENLATRCRACNSRKGVTLGEKPINSEPLIDPPSEPLKEVPGSGSGSGSGRGSTERLELPDDFPRELRPHLRIVFKVLRGLAERHNARAVPPLAVAAVVMGRPHKPLVASAYDFAGWADSQAVRRKDVVAGYRNWLERVNDLAGFEQLGPDGLPAGGARRVQENASSMLRDIWPDASVVDAEAVEESAA